SGPRRYVSTRASHVNAVVKSRYVPTNRDATRHMIQHVNYLLKEYEECQKGLKDLEREAERPELEHVHDLHKKIEEEKDKNAETIEGIKKAEEDHEKATEEGDKKHADE